MFLVVLGAIGDFTSLRFAPQSVVMPVGSFTLVCNVIFAHFWLGEDLSCKDVFGSLVIVSGAATVAMAYGVFGEDVEEKPITKEVLVDNAARPIMVGYLAALGAFGLSMLKIVHRGEAMLDPINVPKSPLLDAPPSPTSGGHPRQAVEGERGSPASVLIA